MRLHVVLVASSALVLGLVAPALAAEAPTVTSVGQKNGRITMHWKLPSDAWKTDLVELGKSSDTARDGAFRDRDLVDVYPPGAAATSYTFDRVNPGTYFVHVSALRKRCTGPEDESCIFETWSPVKKIVVPKPKVPVKRRYAGRTSQGRRISFTVVGDRVRNLRIGYFAPCRFGYQRGTLTVSGPGLKLRRDNTFRDRARLFSSDGSRSLIRLFGRLRGTKRATGTFKYTSRGSAAGACGTGSLTWRAHV
jgi:hypothetical protein